MKTHSKSKKRVYLKKLSFIVFFLLIFIVASIFFTEKLNITNFMHSQNYTTKPEVESTIKNNSTAEDKKNTVAPQKGVTDNQTEGDDFTVSITTIDNSAGIIKIRSIIDGAISNGGSCELIATKGTNIITQTSETYAMPSYSTCKGFEIDSSAMTSGLWEIKLNVSINGKTSSVIKNYTL